LINTPSESKSFYLTLTQGIIMQAAQSGLAAMSALAPMIEPANSVAPVATIHHEPTLDPEDAPAPVIPVNFRKLLAPYRVPRTAASVWQLVTTFVPFISLIVGMYFAYAHAPLWVVVLMGVPTAMLMIRLFIIHHDCGHGSFFKSKTANDFFGAIFGTMTLTPYLHWRWTHAMHHGSAGDLDHRGYGDIPTFTVDEYLAMSPLKQLIYRVYRFPLVIFGLLPFFIFSIYQRFPIGLPKAQKKARRSVYITNIVLIVYAAIMIPLVGFWAFFWVHAPFAAMASTTGVWLFYVQHQYENTYWARHDEWDFARAAMSGSSYYVLPKWLQWCTANIGLHHIHHLDSRIPNYNLQRCYDENPALQKCEHLTLWQSFHCANLKLWDEDQQKMVTFAQARKVRKARKEQEHRKAA